MAKNIEAINRDTVHKICSGQVVLNLATAVKELVENSLDAGATQVEVRLKEYGSESIEVSDNGKGIHPEDFEALALKHHTSKIRDFDDLVDVQTFGFRGEALSSLSAVSEMVVTTRYVNELCGSKLKFDHRGVLQEEQSFARQVGTTVTLTNLFSSLPVRQKEFHRNLKKEFTKAVQLLSAYCLISNNVKITCVNQTKKSGRTTFLATQENKTIRENISCVFGSKQLTNLLQISDTIVDKEILEEYGIKAADTETFRLEGFISSCEHGVGRSTTDRQFYYINSRPCEPAKVMKLANDVYHRYNQHQYPFILMNINVARESVDVNVTPDKRLIFLENEKLLLASVKSTLMKLLENIPSTYRINTPESLLSSRSDDGIVEGKVTSTNQLLDLNRWRNSADTLSRQHRLGTTQKRSSSQQLQDSSSCKQMKLDQVFKRVNIIESTKPAEIDPHEDEHNISHTADSSSLGSRKVEAIGTEETVIQLDYAEIENNKTKTTTFVEIPPKVIARKEETFSSSSDLRLDNQVSISNEEDEAHWENSYAEETIQVEQAADIDESENTTTYNISSKIIDETPLQIGELRNQKAVINTDIDSIRKSFREKLQRKKDSAKVHNRFHVEIDPTKNTRAEEELKKEISKSMFNMMKIIGQFNLGFIIVKLENDLFIVDQHASDEKYNFETLQRTTSLKTQKLIIPQDLNLTAVNECILMDNIAILQKNGFEFSIDPTAEATKRVKLISIPVSQNWQFGKEDIDEMLFMLQDAPDTLCRPYRIRAMFASRACRKSVMIGTALSVKDMRRLINNMGTIEHPWNCPHGRPTMRHLVNLSLLT